MKFFIHLIFIFIIYFQLRINPIRFPLIWQITKNNYTVAHFVAALSVEICLLFTRYNCLWNDKTLKIVKNFKVIILTYLKTFLCQYLHLIKYVFHSELIYIRWKSNLHSEVQQSDQLIYYVIYLNFNEHFLSV